MPNRHILWWGRFDPDYSRNRVVRHCMQQLGYQLSEFSPRLSVLGDLQATLTGLPRPDLIWVPCFRQRDIAAAARWGRRKGVPVVFDPLISAYDKQVFERQKYLPDSAAALRLKRRESAQFQSADWLVADTAEHAELFAESLGADRNRLGVVHVGAEAALFTPQPPLQRSEGSPLEVLFYGSFIPLQGPQWIIEAARLYSGPPVNWQLLGDGPLLADCQARAEGLDNVQFEPWIPYRSLPDRIARADVLLGVFGTTPKAGRVIPNKVFQALASARPVVTRSAPSYPDLLSNGIDNGCLWVPPGDPQALADAVSRLAQRPHTLAVLGEASRLAYETHFSDEAITQELAVVIDRALSGMSPALAGQGSNSR